MIDVKLECDMMLRVPLPPQGLPEGTVGARWRGIEDWLDFGLP